MRVFPIIVAMLLLLDARNIHGYSLSVEGYVRDSSFQVQREPRTNEFSLHIKGDNWNIRVSQHTGTIQYWEAGRDKGIDRVFSLGMLRFEAMAEEFEAMAGELAQAAPRIQATLNLEPSFGALGYVEHGHVPRVMGNSPAIPILWYAYCSAAYLDLQDADAQLEIPFCVDDELHHFEYGIQSVATEHLHRNDSPPHLPRKMVFAHKGMVWTLDGPKRLRGPFREGFTNAVFSATNWTNVGPFSIPTDIQFDFYAPIPNASGSGPTRTRSIQIHASSVTSADFERDTFLPAVRVPASIVDKRFMSPEQPMMLVQYVTNQWLLADHQVKGLGAYSNAVERQQLASLSGQPTHVGMQGLRPAPASHAPWKVFTILLTILLLFSLPIAYAIRRKPKS